LVSVNLFFRGRGVADKEQLKRLKNGIKEWNEWRSENPVIFPDLRRADLKGADLSAADLSGAILSGANIRRADLSDAILYRANLGEADLSGAILSGAILSDAILYRANLSDAILSGAILSGANIRRADLSGADLSGVNLSNFNLSGANLSHIKAIATSFLNSNLTSATLTGACIQDWHINSGTQLDDVKCEYVYLKDKWSNQELKYIPSDRRPSDPNAIFAPGEFVQLFQKALETVDLIFADGIDWQAFFQSFQELRSQYDDDNLSIQAIEKKSGGAFVIRLEVPPEADKGAIESQAKELYESKLQLIEARYQAELRGKNETITVYQQQLEAQRLQSSADLITIVQTLSRAMPEPQPTNQTIINNPQYIAALNTGSGTISDVTQNIGSNLDEITKLINALRETAQTFPEEQRQEAEGHLEDLGDDLKQTPSDRTIRRIKATLATLFAIGCTIAGTADFSNNVLEISNKLGVPIVQAQTPQPIAPAQQPKQ
jgi:uncharacterized protein YjbI with pentapeptide repeats